MYAVFLCSVLTERNIIYLHALLHFLMFIFQFVWCFLCLFPTYCFVQSVDPFCNNIVSDCYAELSCSVICFNLTTNKEVVSKL